MNTYETSARLMKDRSAAMYTSADNAGISHVRGITQNSLLCRIWGSRSGGHEELYFLGYNIV
jgi:hypothetical protein